MSEIDNIIQKYVPYYDKDKGKKPVELKIKYDSPTETLEPLYFWTLNMMGNFYRDNIIKLIDNFVSSPGSGHFSELGTKKSQMQQEASRVLGTVNNILKGVLNLIYDLKEFKTRLASYEHANSKNKEEKEAGILSLKQIWMDRVDVQRGQGSINALTSGDLNFVTLRDAFLAAKDEKDIDKIDINERVKRILKPRIQEFMDWKERSETELRKRYEIEKSYLKSQVAALKLNARWAKPYLRAAARLEGSESMLSNPGLVTVFNTLLLELTLMGHKSLKIDELVLEKQLPPGFKKLEKKLRKYNSVTFIDFQFRGIPQKSGQHYTFGGKAQINLKSYALTDDEINLLKYELEQSDIGDSLRLIDGMTEESIEKLQIDIDEILGDEDKKKKEMEKQNNNNPFTAFLEIFDFSKKEKKDDKEDIKKRIKEMKEKGLKKDNYAEQYLRAIAEANAINSSWTIYEVYKKAHGMATFPYVDGVEPEVPHSEINKIFRFDTKPTPPTRGRF